MAKRHYASSHTGHMNMLSTAHKDMERDHSDGMLHDDPRAIANMPQEVMIKAYPQTGPSIPDGLDDTIRGVDKQMDLDDRQRARGFKPTKV